MLDVTVDDKTNCVEVDGRKYYISNQQNILDFVSHLIEQVKYSGESVVLYKAIGHQKALIKDWH